MGSHIERIADNTPLWIFVHFCLFVFPISFNFCKYPSPSATATAVSLLLHPIDDLLLQLQRTQRRKLSVTCVEEVFI